MNVLATQVADHIERADRITVLTGAGMSAESGIPTFRGDRNGLWARFDPETLATADAWRADKELVWGWYLWRMALVRRAQPNAGHLALAHLAQRKPELRIVTQNVDDLHERAGSREVIHLHGSLFTPHCFACRRPHPAIDIPDAAADAPELRVKPPVCLHCGGHIRPGVVWFREMLPQQPWRYASRAATDCDLLLVIGTSGLVHPAASLPVLAKEAGATVIEINPSESAVSESSDVTWRTTAAQALPALQALLMPD